MFMAFLKNRTQKRTQYYVPITFQRPERGCVTDQPQPYMPNQKTSIPSATVRHKSASLLGASVPLWLTPFVQKIAIRKNEPKKCS